PATVLDRSDVEHREDRGCRQAAHPIPAVGSSLRKDQPQPFLHRLAIDVRRRAHGSRPYKRAQGWSSSRRAARLTTSLANSPRASGAGNGSDSSSKADTATLPL